MGSQNHLCRKSIKDHNAMHSERFIRQSFLGPQSEDILRNCQVAIVGLGGGGSHIAQQLSHIGIGKFVLLDPDVVEEKNLNRLVGGTAADAENATRKTEVAYRMIQAVNPNATVFPLAKRWQAKPEMLSGCDVIFGCVDRYLERDQLE